MENQGVICDVCACTHHAGHDKCALSQITVTENCRSCTQAVSTPHFCKSFEEKDEG